MTTRNLEYYRYRAGEELAAAERARDPAIALIHREMEQRYRAKLGRTADLAGASSAGP